MFTKYKIVPFFNWPVGSTPKCQLIVRKIKIFWIQSIYFAEYSVTFEWHYSDVTWSPWHLKSPITRLFVIIWWRHPMETFPVLLELCAGNSPVTGEFPAQRPMRRSFDVLFDLHLNKRLSKQSWGGWSVTPSRSLWRRCSGHTACSTYSKGIVKAHKGPMIHKVFSCEGPGTSSRHWLRSHVNGVNQ